MPFIDSISNLLPRDKLYNWRLQQLELLLKQGLPTRKTEDWKYTDTTEIMRSEFGLVDKDFDVSDVPELDLGLTDVTSIVFVNGVYSQVLSDNFDIDGLSILPILSEATSNQDELLSLSKPTIFGLINNALFENGLQIIVKDNAVIEKPLHLIHLQTDVDDKMVLQPIKIIINAGVNSSLSILEEYISISSEVYFNNVCTKIIAQDGSKVSHYLLQQESLDAYHIGHMQFDLHKDSFVESYQFYLGAKLSRYDQHFRFLAQGASAKIIGLYQVESNQHVDIHTHMDHLVSHCNSDQVYRGIMSDKSHAVFNGKIYVEKNAAKTKAELNNMNLLISEHAEVDTKPELEIYADDVKCSHGATVGCLDQNALFYLQSRGIEKIQAEAMLVQAFMSELLDSLPESNIKNYIKSVMDNDI